MKKQLLSLTILVISVFSFTQGQRLCHTCDSAINPSCATLSEDLPQKTCLSQDDRCFSAIIDDRTVRGCLAEDYTGTCEGALCESCGANYCNAGIFPLDRAHCHKCSGANCGEITNNDNLEVCQRYVPGDACYSIVPDETLVTYRGCLSDPDTDLGRQECSRLEEEGFCATCSGSGCNNGPAVKTSSLSCLKCYNEVSCRYLQLPDYGIPCETGDILLGRPGYDAEYCYSYVSGNSVTRGCLYDPFTTINVTACENGDPSCSLCTGNNCNSENYAVHTCYSCDGHDDPNCGTLTDAWYEPQTCPPGYADQVGCFVANTDGVPMRGCISQLNEDEISFCSGSSSQCTLCYTDNCNREPKRCITCDSSNDPNCAIISDPTALLAYSQTCPSSSAICISRVSNGYTQRACSGTGISCTSGNPCFQCDGANCNNEVLPTDRLRCHKCSGAGCTDITGTDNPEYCELYNANDQCFTVVTETEVAHRGCYSDPASFEAKSVCLSHESGEDHCVKCQGDGCNTQAIKSTPSLSCVKCSGPNCKDSQASTPGQACFGDILLGRSEKCYSYIHDNGEVERGCLYDANTPAVIANACANNAGGRCRVCEAGNCNTEAIAITETCYTCDESLNPNCRTMTGTIPTKQCPIGTLMGCFLAQVDGVFVRGCAGDLVSGEITLCQRGQTCKLCDGNNCNEKVDFQRCHSCNSASNGEACVNAQNTANQVTCSDYMDSCITAIDNNGATIRGCASQYSSQFPQCNSFTCQTCTEGYCNSNVFPASRTQCHQCSLTDQCAQSLTSSSDTLKVCQTYSTTDSCYSVVVDGQIHRGCRSDGATTGNNHCDAAGAGCITCQNENACNNAAARTSASLSCVKCAATDVACLWGFSNNAATPCTSDVWLGQRESCFSVQSGSSAIRGCTLDNPSQCPDSNTACSKCYQSACNTDTYKYQQCLRCSSDASGQDNCGSEPDQYSATSCSGDDQTYEGRGCYVSVDDDGVVRRGCAKDLNAEQLNVCKSDDESCRYCEADGCNDWEAGASAIQALSLGAIILVALAGKFFN